MPIFSPKITKKIAKSGYADIAESLEKIHKWLWKTRTPFIKINTETELGVTVGHCFVLWQVQLHRVERLIISAVSAIENDDTYGLAVLIRAFVESTVILSRVCSHMHEFAHGTISYETFDKEITLFLIGSRSEHQPENPRATNIMTHIPKADRFINERMPMTVNSPLGSIYAALSEYAHPNMQSNIVAIEKVDDDVYHFRHGSALFASEMALLGSLNTSATIFEHLSAFFLTILSEGSIKSGVPHTLH